MRLVVIAAVALFASPAFGQASATAPQTISVTGHGKVSVPPDTANIRYWLRGEGKTPDEATRSMVETQTRVENGVKGFLGPKADIANSDLVVIEVRDPNCKSERNQATLSEGECAIIGYVATAQAEVTTPAISRAGTAVGLASRLGARDARLINFELRNLANARTEAMTRAVADARAQAQVLSAAAGGHLGRVLNINYGSYIATPLAQDLPMVAAPAPPPPPPVQIDMKPRPEDVTADVSVSYELPP
jgi:uncharacterized protein YggE